MLGKYQIVDRLGAGGFGTVYLAVDRLLRRQVALKVPHQQGEGMGHLLEPQLQVRLKHPNIVELITVEENDGLHFMVMEFVEGESLDRQIRQERSLEPQRAVEIALGLCSAIGFAHSHQIIHRDLRPANILMTCSGIPKITDFGTSRILDMEVESYARTRIGSPPYMAPEHFRGRAVFQSDLWSLGITMYEMLTGTVPFYDVDPIKIAQAFTTRDIVPPHLRNPKVPKAFSDLVMKCLKINLGERVISALDLQKSLNALNEPKEQGLAGTQQLPMRVPAFQNQQLAGHAPSHSAAQEKLCRFCFHPLPRMATVCPRCREKN